MNATEAVKKLSRMYEKQHSILLSVYEQLKNAQFTISERDNPQESENGKVAEAIVKIKSKELPF